MTTTIGDYELDVQVGAGSTGVVWRARRNGPVAQVVALKQLRVTAGQQDLDRIRREAAVLAELDHPHIVRALDVLDDQDGVAVVMQWAPGGSLQALLHERGKLGPTEVAALAAPVADALESAHRRGILHGDVKPANILFTSDGEPLLGDFSVARTLGRATDSQVAGSAEYLAPELLDGAPPSAAADVYSLGVVCYQALAGKPPFDGSTPLAVVRAADRGAHQPLTEMPDVPPELATVVERALSRHPDQRFASAKELATALRGSVGHHQLQLPRPTGHVEPVAENPVRGTRSFGPRPPRPEAHRQRSHKPLVAVTAAVLGVALVGVVYLVPSSSAPDEQAVDDACPELEEPVVQPRAQVITGDPDGDGCDTHGIYQLQTFPDGERRMVLTIRLGDAQRDLLLGESNDQLLLGDWNCDGADTPGLYHTTRGEVHYYHTWPDEEGQVYEPDQVDPVGQDGTAELVREADDADDTTENGAGADGVANRGCDRIRVTTET